VKQFLKVMAACCTVLALAACGGGGGNASSVKTSTSGSSSVASAVNYLSADPEQISISGSGGREWSYVTFKVIDSTGAISVGASATVSLTKNPGGVGLDSADSTSDLSLTSDSKGIIGFKVYAGRVPGPVEVKVSLANSSASAYSKNLTVQSGPPTQSGFSLAASEYNIEGKAYQGTTTTLTIQPTDHYGNAVPDGTVINFTAEGGQISASCTTSRVNGISSCQVTFSSGSNVPSDGRISILAHAEGVKDYSDTNSNGTYGSGDTLSNIGDAYRDDNENRTYDSDLGEFTITRGGSVECSGSGGSAPSRKDTCSAALATTVRRQLVLIMSGSTAKFGSSSVSTSSITFTLTDDGGVNPMPAGTTIVPTVTDSTDNSLACTAKANPSDVPNTNISTGTDVTIQLTNCAIGDSITVDVTTKKGNVTSKTFTL